MMSSQQRKAKDSGKELIVTKRSHDSNGEQKKVNEVVKISLQTTSSLLSFAVRYLLLLTAFFSLPLTTSIWADSNPANDSAGLEIKLFPSVDRGVVIDTETVNLNLGFVDMGVSTQTVSPATITIVGTIMNTELNMSALITGGWTFDEEVAESTETDKLAAWVVFKTTTSSAVPSKSGSDFDDAQDSLNSNSAVFGPVRVGTQGGDSGLNGRFEDGSINMDSLFPGNKRHAWIYFRTPPNTSVSTEQQIHFTLTVTPGP